MDSLAFRDPSDERRVVVRVAGVRVPAPKRTDRLEREHTRREETRRSLGISIELRRSEACRPGLREVLVPRKLGDELPKGGIPVPVDRNVDVRSPYAVTGLRATGHEEQRIGREREPAVEEQDPIARRCIDACAPGFETTLIGLPENLQR